MTDTRKKPFDARLTRRSFLQRAGAGGAAVVLGATPWRTALAAAKPQTPPVSTPLEHVIISCQENRSFDHYYGYAAQVQLAGLGPPLGYSQPDGAGGLVVPYEFTSLSTPDIGHSWTAVHDEWNGGAMDGFYTADGISAMGYYTFTTLGAKAAIKDVGRVLEMPLPEVERSISNPVSLVLAALPDASPTQGGDLAPSVSLASPVSMRPVAGLWPAQLSPPP